MTKYIRSLITKLQILSLVMGSKTSKKVSILLPLRIQYKLQAKGGLSQTSRSKTEKGMQALCMGAAYLKKRASLA